MKAEIINRARNFSTAIDNPSDPVAVLRDAFKRQSPQEIANGQIEVHCDRQFLDACLSNTAGCFDVRDDPTHFSFNFEGAPVRVIEPEQETDMSFFGGGPSAPPPPPPPPSAPLAASPSIAQSAAMEKETLASAEGGGLEGTDVTGGQGVDTSKTSTTKTLLGA